VKGIEDTVSLNARSNYSKGGKEERRPDWDVNSSPSSSGSQDVNISTHQGIWNLPKLRPRAWPADSRPTEAVAEEYVLETSPVNLFENWAAISFSRPWQKKYGLELRPKAIEAFDHAKLHSIKYDRIEHDEHARGLVPLSGQITDRCFQTRRAIYHALLLSDAMIDIDAVVLRPGWRVPR
jgi:hypothetical protein